MIIVGALSVAEAKPITVGLNKEKQVAGSKLRVRFVEMVEDSRCPADVECVWAGNAKIRLQVKQSGRTETITLETMNSSAVVIDGYSFKLTELTPVPRSNIRIDQSKYVATIDVVKVAGKSNLGKGSSK